MKLSPEYRFYRHQKHLLTYRFLKGLINSVLAKKNHIFLRSFSHIHHIFLRSFAQIHHIFLRSFWRKLTRTIRQQATSILPFTALHPEFFLSLHGLRQISARLLQNPAYRYSIFCLARAKHCPGWGNILPQPDKKGLHSSGKKEQARIGSSCKRRFSFLLHTTPPNLLCISTICTQRVMYSSFRNLVTRGKGGEGWWRVRDHPSPLETPINTGVSSEKVKGEG